MSDKNQARRVAAQFLAKKASTFVNIFQKDFDVEKAVERALDQRWGGGFQLAGPIQAYGHPHDGLLAVRFSCKVAPPNPEYVDNRRQDVDLTGEIRLSLEIHGNKVNVVLLARFD